MFKMITLLTCMLLLACSNEISQAPAAHSQPKSKLNQTQTQTEKAQQIEPQTSMTKGKPSAPINVEYQLLTPAPKPGDEIHIQLNLTSVTQSPIDCQLISANQLTWLNQQTGWQIQADQSGNYAQLPLFKMVAPAEGLFYLYLSASIEIDGQIMQKPFAIPVAVGDISKLSKSAAAKSADQNHIQIDQKGQKILIQKAQKVD